MARRITILGMGPSANERRFDIAHYVEGTEVWGLNNGMLKFPGFTRWARWYEVHALDYLDGWARKYHGGLVPYCRMIDALDVPVYRSEILPSVRNQIEFPELEMCVNFGCNFWDGTPTRMFAHAIFEHDKGDTIEEIQSYGIDMQDDQHAAQLPAWMFWLGQAQSRGIKTGGTARARMDGAESDEGTAALRGRIAEQMAQRKEQEK